MWDAGQSQGVVAGGSQSRQERGRWERGIAAGFGVGPAARNLPATSSPFPREAGTDLGREGEVQKAPAGRRWREPLAMATTPGDGGDGGGGGAAAGPVRGRCRPPWGPDRASRAARPGGARPGHAAGVGSAGPREQRAGREAGSEGTPGRPSAGVGKSRVGSLLGKELSRVERLRR